MNNKSQNKYYPQFINQQQTQIKIGIQIRLVSQICKAMSRRVTVPKILLQNISSYCFSNPISVYDKICLLSNDKNITVGQYLLVGEQNYFLDLKIINIWWKNNTQKCAKNTMIFANHFLNFIQLTKFEINDTYQSQPEKWSLICKNMTKFLLILNNLRLYQRLGKINESIVNSFTEIMKHDVILLKIDRYNYIYIGNEVLKVADRRKENKISLQFGFNGGQCFLYSEIKLGKKVSSLPNRNKNSIIKVSGHQIIIDDIFLTNSQQYI